MDGDFEGLDAELDHEAEDEGDAAGADGAYTLVELEEDPCYEAVEISELRDTLIFSVSCEPESVDVEVGDVLVGVSDGGYLGQIVSLEFGDETLTVHIEPVALAEVIGDGSFSTEVELNHRAIVDVSGKVLYQENFGGMLVESGFRSGAIVARGKLHLDGEIEGGRLQMFESVLETNLDVNFQYYVAASGGHSFQKTTTLESFSIPFAFVVSGVPVVGRLELAVIAKARSSAPGYIDLSTGYQANTRYELGGRYEAESGWDGVASKEKTSSSNGLQLDGNASWNGRVDLYLKPALRFYEVVSLEGKQGLYLRGYTQPRCDGLNWGVAEGYGGSMGIALTVFDWWTPDMSIELPGDENALVDGTFDYPGAVPSWLEAVCDQEDNDTLGGLGSGSDNPAAGNESSGDAELPGSGSQETSWVQAQGIACDVPVSGNSATVPFATDTLDGYSCNVGNYESPEVVYSWTASMTGPVRFELQNPQPTEVNHDLFVLENTSGLPVAGYGAACTASGLNSLPFDAVAGETYLLVIDGYAGDAGPYQAVLNCDP